MQALEALFANYAKRRRARWWVGEKPDVREGQLARAIAGKVEYPTAGTDPFVVGGMVQLSWSEAAHVLAVAGSTSLVYYKGSPPKGRVKEAMAALKELTGAAVFLGNGYWDAAETLSWIPLTSATFDCGVIGYDTENAFIFWVEEED